MYNADTGRWPNLVEGARMRFSYTATLLRVQISPALLGHERPDNTCKHKQYAGTVDRCQRSVANADPSGLRVRLPVSAFRQSSRAGAMDWRPCTAGTGDP